MDVRALSEKPHVSGSRATLKAIRKGQATAVFLAADAEKRLTQPLREASEQAGLAVTEIATMRELGRAAALEVPTAAVALIK